MRPGSLLADVPQGKSATHGKAPATPSFSPLAGRRCRQADEGPHRLSTPSTRECVVCPSYRCRDLLPASGEKEGGVRAFVPKQIVTAATSPRPATAQLPLSGTSL